MSGFFSVQGLGGFAVFLVGMWLLRDGILKLRRWPRALGTVIGKQRVMGLMTPEIEFVDGKGESRRFLARLSYRHRAPVGSNVKVMYDPHGVEEPEQVSIMNVIVAPIFTAGFGLWFALIAAAGRG